MNDADLLYAHLISPRTDDFAFEGVGRLRHKASTIKHTHVFGIRDIFTIEEDAVGGARNAERGSLVSANPVPNGKRAILRFGVDFFVRIGSGVFMI